MTRYAYGRVHPVAYKTCKGQPSGFAWRDEGPDRDKEAVERVLPNLTLPTPLPSPARAPASGQTQAMGEPFLSAVEGVIAQTEGLLHGGVAVGQALSDVCRNIAARGD